LWRAKIAAAIKTLLRHVTCQEAGLDEARRFVEAKQAARAAITAAEGTSS